MPSQIHPVKGQMNGQKCMKGDKKVADIDTQPLLKAASATQFSLSSPYAHIHNNSQPFRAEGSGTAG